MRPRRFHPWAEEVISKSPAVENVQTGGEGIDEFPFGTSVTFKTGARVLIGWVSSAPPGGDMPDQPEKIVEKDPPEPVEVPDLATSGRLRLVDIEAHLAALLNNGGHPEMVRVVGYHGEPDERREQRTLQYGIRVYCHSGGSVTGVFKHTLPPGVQPSGQTEWRQREEV